MLGSLEVEDQVFEFALRSLCRTGHELAQIAHTMLDINSILRNVQQRSKRRAETVLIPTCPPASASSGGPFKSICVLSGVAFPAL